MHVAAVPENILETIKEFGPPDIAIAEEDQTWVPFDERASWKPLRFDLSTGMWVVVTRVKGAGVISRHQHTGPVSAYTLQGSWYYPEHDWVARPGTFVFEPPGDVHTLTTDDPEGMTTLFIMNGVMRFLDDKDQLIDQHDCYYYLDQYVRYCRSQGFEPDSRLFH
ncbi:MULTISPECIES: 2,4'-dihydroxyacetophenone dioxygenase family protein [Streptomyces]|uniref:2,4'-dihydroxyacetophenone dioxygenase family protein n=1 Tax=Streptomyces TaxID=1883 RepID=UPI0033A91DF2